MEANEGEKLHGCINCDKSFKLKGNLKAHMETEHGSKNIFMCTICNVHFSQKANLQTQISVVHLG